MQLDDISQTMKNKHYQDALGFLDQAATLLASKDRSEELPRIKASLGSASDSLELAVYTLGIPDDNSAGSHPVVIECRRYQSLAKQYTQLQHPSAA